MTIDHPTSAPSKPWPSASQYSRSIWREFALYVGGLVVLLMFVAGVIVSDKLVTAVTEEIVDQLLTQARSSAAVAAKQIIAADGPDILLLTDICNKMKAENPECGWAGVADTEGKFLAHTDMRQVVSGAYLRVTPTVGYSGTLRMGEKIQISPDSIFVATPILEQRLILGSLVSASSTVEIGAVKQSVIRMMVIFTTVMALVGVALIAIVLKRRLHPLHLITESLRTVETGNLALDPPVKGRNEFGYLADTMRVMGARLEQAQKQAVENDRMIRELDIAREIQANILPKGYPTGRNFQLSGAYRSARTVGGDYYDFIDLGSGRLALLVGDVSGKSLPGMLVMLLTRNLVMKHARSVATPAELLSAVNRDLLPEIRKGTFVTMFCGFVDTTSGQMQFASAGHNPLIHTIAATGEQRLIKTKGYPLGMMSPDQFDRRIEFSQLQLAENDWCVLYTDGINEAMNRDHKEYGMERFLAALRSAEARSSTELVRSVMVDVERFVGDSAQADDITLLSMHWVPERIGNPIHGQKGLLNASNG